MDGDYEILLVNDGSTDGTERLLEGFASADRRIKVLTFSRNFGHQAAITAGLDFAAGDAVVVMDADLQDPPELLPAMVKLWGQGYDVVSAQRQTRHGDGFCKRATASAFYWFMRRFIDQRLQPEVGDFRLFSRDAVLALREFREQHRFMRGLVAWLGLKEVIIPFQREARFSGVTKYPLANMLRFAWTAISSFSAFPLRCTSTIGLGVMLFGIAYFAYALFAAIGTRTAIQGWTSLVCLQIVFSGAILMAVGVLGSYVSKIYEESKYRPLYVVSAMMNAGSQWQSPDRGVVLQSRLIPREVAGVRSMARGTKYGQ
jgi:dolichol-phosphate mannosyltransferase